MFGFHPWNHWKRHDGCDGTIAAGAHPGVYGSPFYHDALHGSCPSSTIASLGESRANKGHLNPPRRWCRQGASTIILDAQLRRRAAFCPDLAPNLEKFANTSAESLRKAVQGIMIKP
jgi:hypothetical protein